MLGSARRASGGFPSRRELNFHFCSRTQKGLQNGSQNGAFWAPKSQLYSLWGTLWEKWVPKKGCQKKVAIKSQKRQRFWGGPAAGGGALELKKSSKFAEKHALKLKIATLCRGVCITLCSPYGGRRILRASPPAAGPLLQAAGCWLLAGWLAAGLLQHMQHPRLAGLGAQGSDHRCPVGANIPVLGPTKQPNNMAC